MASALKVASKADVPENCGKVIDLGDKQGGGMKQRIAIFFGLFLFLAGSADIAEASAKTKCHLSFNLRSWSVFYKSGRGEGYISCDNGQATNVGIRAHGGGVTFGKSRIENGRGSFSKVRDISELYGSYAASEAHAGASGSAAAEAMTKGDISLALSGTGKGFNLGFAFGSFKITPR